MLLTVGVAGASFGTVQEFTVPTANSGPSGIASGPDGRIWFTEYGDAAGHGSNKIGRITPTGTITEYPIPTAGSRPQGIAAGPDGNLWFVEYASGKIGRITTAGAVTEYTLPTRSTLYKIATPPLSCA